MLPGKVEPWWLSNPTLTAGWARVNQGLTSVRMLPIPDTTLCPASGVETLAILLARSTSLSSCMCVKTTGLTDVNMTLIRLICALVGLCYQHTS